MTLTPWIGYLGGSALVAGASRIWVRFRRDRRARREFASSIFSSNLLDNALRPETEDDADVLDELRQVLGHLNRQSYAEEFWRLDEQLAAYYARLPKASRPTFRRALMRLLRADNRWLLLVSAKTCARIGFPEAEPALESILQAATRSGAESEADARFGAELQTALDRLRQSQAVP
jgi:hypothetical protein